MLKAEFQAGDFDVLMVDVDGVLVTGRPTDGEHWSSSLEEDLGVDPKLLHERFFAPHFQEVVTGRANLTERLAPVLADIAPQVTVDSFIDYWFSQDARLDRQLIADLEELRSHGVSVQIATNQEHLRAAYLISELALGEICDHFHYSARLGCRKPDARFFALAGSEAGCSPERIFLLDDSAENVAAARGAGWRAAQWNSGDRLHQILATRSVK